MLPWWSPAPHIQRQLIVCSCLLTHLLCYHGTLADTSFNQSLINQITVATRDTNGSAPEAAVSPTPDRSPGLSTYLLTVRLGGEDAYATPMLIGVTQAVIADQLKLQANSNACQVVEAANVTHCVDGAPVPSADSEVYFPPQTGPNELSEYLRQVWRSTSNVPAPPFQGLNQSEVPQMDTTQYFSNPKPGTTSGRRLLSEGSRRLHEAPAPLGCYDESQITLKISFLYTKTEEQWNSTIDFFVSGRFLAKMQSKDINLLNAQLLGYQEPAFNSTPKPLDPTRTPNAQEIHTLGPQGGLQQQSASALEFTLQVVGDDANVTNDALLGALYDMIVTPQPGVPGGEFLSSDNTAITIIRSAPPVSVGVALGRRLMAMSSRSLLSGLRKLLQQAPPPLVPVDPSNIPNAQFNISKPSMDITFRLRAVPAQNVTSVRDAVNGLIKSDQFLRGFQDRGISVYQVSLESFDFLPAPVPQAVPPAPPPVLILATRKSSDGPRTTIIVVAVVPVTVLAIALGIFAVCWMQRQKQRNQAYSSSRDSHAKLTLKESELSGSSSFSDHLSDKAVSAAAIIKRMHPDSLSQSGFLDMSWSDWKIDPQEITILARPDGSEWLLGSGASGRVYKALRNGVQIVAVKLFKEEMTRGAINSLTSPKHAEQFRREINILKTCHDKNIVQFLGACLTDTQTIMVTEYLENGDLYNAINSQQGGRYHWYRMQQPNGRPVPNSGMARRVALDIARGLHFLHTKKIVHFDLKSANILLARDFTAKIADVGLARILQDDMLSTRKEVGTFAWAAPEVLLGQRTTEAADIYSFGVLLHELSALESPCGQRHLRRVRVPEECPPEVHDLMYRCLDPNQRNRPSARDLVAALSCLPAVPPFPPPQRLASRDSPSHSRHNSFSRSSFSVQCHPIVEERLRQPNI